MIQRIPILLSIFGMICGTLIAIFFGINEDLFKNHIAEGLNKNLSIQSLTSPEERASKVDSEKKQNWRYYQRYHFHANGIASMSLALLLLLQFISATQWQKVTVAYMVAVGGFCYPFLWLFAAIYGPEIGRHNAKELFAPLGYMGGVFLVGVIALFYLAATKPFLTPFAFGTKPSQNY